MSRLYLLVEGQTELAIAKGLLLPHLRAHGLQRVDALIVGTGRTQSGQKHRGGGSWGKWRDDIHRLLDSKDGALRVTTLFDLYGLPKDFPQLSNTPPRQTPTERK